VHGTSFIYAGIFGLFLEKAVVGGSYIEKEQQLVRRGFYSVRRKVREMCGSTELTKESIG